MKNSDAYQVMARFRENPIFRPTAGNTFKIVMLILGTSRLRVVRYISRSVSYGSSTNFNLYQISLGTICCRQVMINTTDY